jgi:hypothetical protein
VLVWQALLKKDDITTSFRSKCGEEWAAGDTDLSRVSDLAWRFWCPWRRSWLCCCARGGANAGHARLRDDGQ